MTPVFVSWAPYCSRSDNIARELGGASYMVYWGRLGSHPLTVGFKYLGQFFETIRVLRRTRASAIFVMTPPLFAGLAVHFYSRLARVPFVIDAHTAAFMHPRWARFQWLQGWLCRRAATTLVTNDHLAARVQSMGGHATIVRDVPVVWSFTEPFTPAGAFVVAVVCSFNDDEPVGEMIQAAAQLPDVSFYLTGDAKKLDPSLAAALPPTVTLTGFLLDSAYGALLSRADTVMTLTTRDHTMLRGAYEAVYQGTPVIVSSFPLLRAAFDEGAIHVDNTARDIVRAVRDMRANLPRYRSEVLSLRERKRREWSDAKQRILARIGRGAVSSA